MPHSHPSVAALFERRALGKPESVALICQNQSYSYADLNARANQLAHALTQSALGLGSIVAIVNDEPLARTLCMLACAKIGAAYMPVSRKLPMDRQKQLLGEASPSALFCCTECCPPEIAEYAPVFNFVDQAALIEQQSPSNPAAPTNPQNPLYILFTSGSTGTPMAVAVPQRAVTRLVHNVDYVNLSPHEVLLHSSAVDFDASTFEIWGALLNGACLVLPPRDFSFESIGDTIDQYAVTTIFLTTRLFDLLVDHALDRLRPLRQILFGGEYASADHVHRAIRGLPDTRLIHVYGPTECTTFATSHTLGVQDLAHPRIPIGHPINQTIARMVDAAGRPIDRGPGELQLGGDGLALGYVNHPQITAERFFHEAQSGERFYRTGDFVEYSDRRGYFFVGRNDRQLKVRGHRIELGEIECCLRKAPDLRQCHVIPTGSDTPASALAAYYETHSGGQILPSELKRHMCESLPRYMIPEHFIHVPRLPLKPNGKMDPAALPPLSHRSPAPGERGAPSTGCSRKWIREVWQDILHHHPIDGDSHFFNLGGDSLLAMEFVIRFEKTWGIRMPAEVLNLNPTLDQLFQHTAELHNPSNSANPLHLEKVNHGSLGRPPLFCIPWLNGSSFSYRDLSHALGEAQPIYVIDGIKQYAPETGILRLADYAARIAEEIANVYPNGPCQLCGPSLGGVIAWETARLLQQAGRDITFLGLIDAPEPGFQMDVATNHLANLCFRLRTQTDYIPMFFEGAWILKSSGRAEWQPFLRFYARRIKRKWGHRAHALNLADMQQRPSSIRRESDLFQSYKTSPYSGPVSLFRSRYPLYAHWKTDPNLGWQAFALGPLERHVVNGNHVNMLRDPFVRKMADLIRVRLVQ